MTGLIIGVVRAMLDRLGITSGGVYTPSSGWAGTATSALNMAGFNITGAATVTAASGTTARFESNDTGSSVAVSNIQLIATGGGQTEARLTGSLARLAYDSTHKVETTSTGTVVYGPLNCEQATVAITTGVGSETVLTQAQSGSLVTNTGTTVKASCQLPASPRVGTFYDFLVDDADGLRVVANTGQTITMDALGTSASAGYVESVRQETSFRLTYTATNIWRGSHMVGTVRKDSTTTMGWAFTPTNWVALSTITATWTSNVTWTGKCRHYGNMVDVQIHGDLSGAPTSATLSFSALQCGGISLAPDESLMLAVGADSGGATIYSDVLVGWGMYCDDSAGVIRNNFACWYSPSADTWQPLVDGISATNAVTQASPITFANHDAVLFRGTWPVPQ